MARKASAQVDEKATEPVSTAADSAIPTEPIEIEIPDSPQVETAIEPEPPKQEVQPPQEDPAIKRRLDEMERANADLARRNQELEQQNATGRRQYANEQQQRFNAQYDAIVNAMGAAESIIESAKQEVRSARADGDIEREVEAQEKWNDAAANKRYLTGQKDQMDAWLEDQKRRPQQPQQQPQQPQRQLTQEELRVEAERAISNFQAPERVKSWLRNHMDYMTDPRKNSRLQAVHNMVVEDGYEAYSEAYVARMEEMLNIRPGAATTNGSGNGAHPPQRQSAPSVSAPPSREAPSMTTGQAPQTTRVRLSPEQREVAWNTRPDEKMTRAEAEKIYAQNLIKMQNLNKQNG